MSDKGEPQPQQPSILERMRREEAQYNAQQEMIKKSPLPTFLQLVEIGRNSLPYIRLWVK